MKIISMNALGFLCSSILTIFIQTYSIIAQSMLVCMLMTPCGYFHEMIFFPHDPANQLIILLNSLQTTQSYFR